ncbi:MAG: Rossmann-like and DUF2520 domain-containing protein [Desulfobacterales bacterium]
MKSSFAIIGCGRVGTALARHLSKAGYPPAGFASRSRESALQAAEAAGAEGAVYDHAWEASAKADVVFISTPDQAIVPACEEIAENRGVQENAAVLHCSGALSSDILAAARQCGAAVGSMHPLQSFAAVTEENPFAGIKMAIEGESAAVEQAWQIAEALGADPISIRTEGKILYHAAAVAASNYLVTLMRLSFDLLKASGVSESEAYCVLKPLISGTLNNIEQTGIPEALTGPIARGDVATVADHLAAIREVSPEAAELYTRLGLATIDIATARGTLSKNAAGQLAGLLSGQAGQ